jgi:hypothetical protein
MLFHPAIPQPWWFVGAWFLLLLDLVYLVSKLTTADMRPEHQLLPLLLKLQPPIIMQRQAVGCHHSRAQRLSPHQTSGPDQSSTGTSSGIQ